MLNLTDNLDIEDVKRKETGLIEEDYSTTGKKGSRDKAYEELVSRAEKHITESFLRNILYEVAPEGTAQNETVAGKPNEPALRLKPNITDVSFDGDKVFVQDNSIGRYQAGSDKDPRIIAGETLDEVTQSDVYILARHVSNVLDKTFTPKEPILDAELGYLRVNFMHPSVSPFGTTMSLRVSRPSLAIQDISLLCDSDTDELLKIFMEAGTNLLISGQTGSGKALTNDTLIPTPLGQVFISDLKVGDFVFDRKGLPTKVLGVYPQGKLDVYEVKLKDGRKAYCNDAHIWTVVDTLGEFHSLTTREMIDTGDVYYLPVNHQVEYPETNLEQDPYVFGKLLSMGDEDEDDYIPSNYLQSSTKQRLELLYGLLDTQNKQDTGIKQMTYPLDSKLGESFISLVRGLGIVSEFEPNRVENTLTINLHMENSIDSGYSNFKNGFEYAKIGVEAITKLNTTKDMTCIAVDNDEKLYLANNYIVTHNTELQKALVGYIPDEHKISLMEDTLDSHIKLLYPKKDLNSWRTTDMASFELLIKASLRNNPEWAMISEVRGAETETLVNAATTGHSIMTTLHASGAKDIPARITNMVALGSSGINYQALQRNILSVLNLGLHMHRKVNPDGSISREIREIVEYTDFNDSEGITGVEIFSRKINYDQETGIYAEKIVKNALSPRLLDTLKLARLYHRVPNVFTKLQ